MRESISDCRKVKPSTLLHVVVENDVMWMYQIILVRNDLEHGIINSCFV